jgi:hypothetical protein
MFVHAKVQEPSAKTLRVTAWLAITAVVAIVLLAATGGSRTALASTSIHQTLPISVNAVAFQGDDEECGQFSLDPGEAVWHFVLTQTSAGVGTILNVTFDNGSQSVAATRKTGTTLHWYVFTTGATQLTAASTSANGGNLNLSHICSGGESSSSSNSSSSSSSSS